MNTNTVVRTEMWIRHNHVLVAKAVVRRRNGQFVGETNRTTEIRIVPPRRW